MATLNHDAVNFRVFVELARRNEVGTGSVNRIPLLVESINITTAKQVINMGVPFSGAVRGESLNLAFDMGQASKTINISGILVGQNIKKQKSTDVAATSTNLTAYELAQLMHSYVDSSSFQDDQNMSKLIILMPSRADENFAYHTNDTEDADIQDLPLIPFTWKNRGYDNDFASLGANSKYYDEYTNATSGENNRDDVTIGVTGFIRSFNTTFAGTEVDSSSKWNGTSWSSAGAVGSSGEHVGGDGSDINTLISGGSGSRGVYANKWNGSSWASTTNIPQSTLSHNHAGKNSESAHVAGGDNAYAYDWDGTTWTSVTTITLGSDTSPRYVSGGGNKDHHWVMCGLDGGSSMNNCTLWNGSSWTAKGNMTESQYAGLGDGTIR